MECRIQWLKSCPVKDVALLMIVVVHMDIGIYFRQCDYGATKVVGRRQEHIKLELVDNKSNTILNGIAFGQSRQAKYIKSKQSFDICYTIEDNAYKHGEVQLQIESIHTRYSR